MSTTPMGAGAMPIGGIGANPALAPRGHAADGAAAAMMALFAVVRRVRRGCSPVNG